MHFEMDRNWYSSNNSTNKYICSAFKFRSKGEKNYLMFLNAWMLIKRVYVCVRSGTWAASSIVRWYITLFLPNCLILFWQRKQKKLWVSINYKSHYKTMTLMQEEVKNAKGDTWDVFQRRDPQRKECVPVYVTEIRGMLQRFKVAITAECSSNGINGTRRAQMAPKSSESFWKGHT